MTYCLPIEAVIATNRRLPDIEHGVLDEGKILGALARPLAGFGGVAVYPTVVGQAAALLEALASAHGFFDGNKRTAWISCQVFLAMHGYRVRTLDAEYSGQFVIDVVMHRIDTVGATLWLVDHLEI